MVFIFVILGISLLSQILNKDKILKKLIFSSFTLSLFFLFLLQYTNLGIKIESPFIEKFFLSSKVTFLNCSLLIFSYLVVLLKFWDFSFFKERKNLIIFKGTALINIIALSSNSIRCSVSLFELSFISIVFFSKIVIPSRVIRNNFFLVIISSTLLGIGQNIFQSGVFDFPQSDSYLVLIYFLLLLVKIGVFPFHFASKEIFKEKKISNILLFLSLVSLPSLIYLPNVLSLIDPSILKRNFPWIEIWPALGVVFFSFKMLYEKDLEINIFNYVQGIFLFYLIFFFNNYEVQNSLNIFNLAFIFYLSLVFLSRSFSGVSNFRVFYLTGLILAPFLDPSLQLVLLVKKILSQKLYLFAIFQIFTFSFLKQIFYIEAKRLREGLSLKIIKEKS